MKIIVMFFLLVIISACSLDTKSGIWNEKKVINKKLILSSEDLNEYLTYDEYKATVIEYGKKGKFSELNINK